MTAAVWGTILAAVSVLLAIFGVISRSLAKEQARQEKIIDELIRRMDKTFDDLRKDSREEVRRLEDLAKVAVGGLDTRLQNEIQMLIDASHLRIAALEARSIEIDKQLREITKAQR